MNNDSVNLYCYCSDYVFLHNFTWSNMGEGWTQLVKMWFSFYYTSIDASAQGRFIYNSK